MGNLTSRVVLYRLVVLLTSRHAISCVSNIKKINFTSEWRKSHFCCYNKSVYFKKECSPSKENVFSLDPFRGHVSTHFVPFPISHSHTWQTAPTLVKKKERDIKNVTRCAIDGIVSDFASGKWLFFKRWKPKRGSSSGKKQTSDVLLN